MQMETLWGMRELLDEADRRGLSHGTRQRGEFVDSEKRVRDTSTSLSLFPFALLQAEACILALCDDGARSCFAGYIDVACDDVVGFIRDQFDLRRLNRTGYIPSGFRSDGYQVQVLYMSLKHYKPLVRGTGEIHLAGYKVPEDAINVHAAENGLSLLSATSLYPQQTLHPRWSGVDITAVDPVCSSIVSVRRCPLWACEDPRSIVDSRETWEERGAEYSKKSGRTMLEVRERKLRRKRGGDAKYGKALDECCEVSTKTFVRASLIDYCKVSAKNLKVMSIENGKRDRKKEE